jgi:hypothetical protein
MSTARFRVAVVARPAWRVAHQALDGALSKLERRLVHEESLSRDRRRRPTKYFAARLLTERR